MNELRGAAAPGGGVNPSGLSQREAQERLRRDGPNELPEPERVSVYRRLLAQLTHFFAALLWVAALLAFVARMPELGSAIVIVVLVNGVFAFLQEFRAERAAEALRHLLPARATVLRDGAAVLVEARQLVQGDVVLLSTGDSISADLELIEAHELAIDASALTGESAPERPGISARAYAGTFVVEGEGVARVVATGARTRLASIQRMVTRIHHEPGPLQRELGRVVRVLALIALLVGGGFFAVAAALGLPLSDGFLFAIGVTVALVPEGLLPTVTLSLAHGARRMAEQHALVRRLDAVETLGATTFICTDKTGTLTQNSMQVVEVWTEPGSVPLPTEGEAPLAELAPPVAQALRELGDAALRAAAAGVAASGGVGHGDPLELSLQRFGARFGSGSKLGSSSPSARFPFDPRRRRMSVRLGDWLYVKGAPDSVLLRCSSVPDGARSALRDLSERGLRVIALARRALPAGYSPRSADEAERELELLGLLGLEDPPRPGAAEAVAACRRAGIHVAMLTGDHPGTARAIAREVGLLGAEEIVIEGKELPADDEGLAALCDRDGIVIARVAPEDKLRIARVLRGRGHVVAMTGDGVNDGPALREAHVGVAMGKTGTDVARAAADLVLLNDEFSTIVRAIELGRSTYQNIRRFLTYHLTDNVAELTPFVIWALSGGQFPLALGIMQVLALDIGTDLLPALALGVEAPQRGLLDRPPEQGRLIDKALLVRVFAVLGPTQALFEMGAFTLVLVGSGFAFGGAAPDAAVLAAASGAAFTAVVIGQMGNAFACRSETSTLPILGPARNSFLLRAVLFELFTLLVFLFLGPLARLLGHAPPTLEGAALALLAGPAVLAVDAVHKRWRRGFKAAPPGSGTRKRTSWRTLRARPNW